MNPGGWEPFPGRPWMKQAGAAKGEEGKGLKGLIAGAVTGAIEISITYPTEFIKTQLQLDQGKGQARQYTGVGDVIGKTLKNKGFFGLYRGMGILFIGSPIKQATRFGTYEFLKGFTADAEGSLTPLKSLITGMGAGVSEAILAVTPMETIKVKFINDHKSAQHKYKGLFSGMALIVKEEGFQGMYKGLLPTILRQGSNQAIRFFVMNTLKDKYKESKGDPKAHIPKYTTALFGAIAGAASVFGNTPIDVVKTRMQGLDAKKYKNSLDCAKTLWREGGLPALYKGTLPRLLRVCLDVAITFTIYDTIMELFEKFL